MKPEGGATQFRESDDPIVVVKQPADDLHGDMRRGENRLKALFAGGSRQKSGGEGVNTGVIQNPREASDQKAEKKKLQPTVPEAGRKP